jgi:TorA maturation chaperone TorD
VEALLRKEMAVMAPEEVARQGVYTFLARVLCRAATAVEQERMAALAGSETPLNQAIAEFLQSLGETSETEVKQHYHDLFIGVGRGELLPYGSYYLTGFLNEKPLANLRVSLDRLGFAKAEGVCEPEDHIASLCDVMGQLIADSATGAFDIYDQDRFFAAHIKPWASQFFADLKTAKTAGPYRFVGEIGNHFMAIEEAGFAMIARA